jgi:hypothetical protein
VKLGALGFLSLRQAGGAGRKGRIVTTPDLFKDSLVIALLFIWH